jgi:hypothetical protein
MLIFYASLFISIVSLTVIGTVPPAVTEEYYLLQTTWH